MNPLSRNPGSGPSMVLKRKAILDEYLLPGKDSRTLLNFEALSRDSTCALKAEHRHGQLFIKRREPGILCISLQIFASIRRHSKSAMYNVYYV